MNNIEFINIPNSGKGNCLFLALGKSLGIDDKKLRKQSVEYIAENADKDDFFKNNGFFNEQILTEFCNDKNNINTNKIKQSIKQICSLDNYINNEEEIFEDFIKNCSTIGENCKKDLINLFNKYLIKDYCNCMIINGTYAGLYEIKAIADIYNKQIRIFQITNKTTPFKLTNKYLIESAIINNNIPETIDLLYISDNKHYELLNIKPPTPLPTPPPSPTLENIEPLQPPILESRILNINIDDKYDSDYDFDPFIDPTFNLSNKSRNNVYNPAFKLSDKPILPRGDSFILGNNIDRKLRTYCEFINS
jgi:hypothetical protein